MQRFMHLSTTGSFGRARGWADESLVFTRGTPASHVWFLEHGAVEIVQANQQGQSVVVKILVGPTLFGVIEAMSGEPLYLESVRCLGGARAFQIERDAFAALLSRDAAAAVEVTTDLSLAFATAAKFEQSRLCEVDVLLANLLTAYAHLFGEENDDGVRLRVRRTQEQLAAAVGASDRQITRLVADWKRASRLSKRDGLYILSDPSFFSTLAGELEGSLVHRYAPTSATLPTLKLRSI